MPEPTEKHKLELIVSWSQKYFNDYWKWVLGGSIAGKILIQVLSNSLYGPQYINVEDILHVTVLLSFIFIVFFTLLFAFDVNAEKMQADPVKHLFSVKERIAAFALPVLFLVLCVLLFTSFKEVRFFIMRVPRLQDCYPATVSNPRWIISDIDAPAEMVGDVENPLYDEILGVFERSQNGQVCRLAVAPEREIQARNLVEQHDGSAIIWGRRISISNPPATVLSIYIKELGSIAVPPIGGDDEPLTVDVFFDSLDHATIAVNFVSALIQAGVDDDQDALNAILENRILEGILSNENARFNFLMGILYYQVGDQSAAIDRFTEAIAQEEAEGRVYWDAYLSRANVYLDQEKIDEAIQDYQVLANPEAPPDKQMDGYISQSRAFTAAGRLTDAINALEDALEIKGLDDPTPVLVESGYLYLTEVKDYASAIAKFLEALEHSPDDPLANMWFIIAIVEDGNMQMAQDHFDTAFAHLDGQTEIILGNILGDINAGSNISIDTQHLVATALDRLPPP